ncbi:methylase [Sinomonas atrocyanea]|uniref:Methylase n=1 Tax=Sinomonas atrocyanea TaxID=37927 RepID=A0A126ZX95_9MICC|nr:methylase [Sinomonas atrocyanea]GEB64793.1 methylase [Sinomonas atrocyanea]
MERLRAAGCVFAEEEAALLLEAAEDPGRLEELVALRAAGEPLEHLVGWAEFGGLRIAVGPGVFVPRRRSELLVRLAVAALAHDGGGPPAVVVDLCCGSAALGAAVAAACGGRGWASGRLELHAADLDPAATAYARRNLAPWGGRVHTGDLFAALPGTLRGRVDVIVANAPYVPTDAIALMPPEARDHEPRASLDGGADGLALHRRIAAEAGEWLAPGGSLVIEVGRRQVAPALGLLAKARLAAHAEEDGDLDATAIVAVSG